MTGSSDPRDAESGSEDETLDRLAALLAGFEAERDRGARPSVDDWVARAGALGPRLRPLIESLGVVSDVGRAVDELARVPTRGLERTVSRVGPYRIESELGRGGMGVVYVAREPETGRAIALKVLPLGPAPDQDAVARFRREAHAAARLEHPNIVAVHTVGEDRGTLYYAMQVVDGCSLEQLIRRLSESRPTRGSQVTSQVDARGAVAWATAAGAATTPASPCQLDPRAGARLALGIARALAFAHAAGILHRDVKPANVLVDSGGVARQMDFGLCRLTDHAGLTRTGDIVGTLRYMAPEQIEGEATPRSDVYALGMTLYELLALRPAFETTRRASLLRDILDGAIAPGATLVPDDPAVLALHEAALGQWRA